MEHSQKDEKNSRVFVETYPIVLCYVSLEKTLPPQASANRTLIWIFGLALRSLSARHVCTFALRDTCKRPVS